MAREEAPHSLVSRRRALKALGAGIAAAALPVSGVAATQFPKGAIIRTVLRDLPPEELNGGATLFHEHLSLAREFMPKWISLVRRTAPPAPTNPSQPYFMQDA